MSLWTVKALLGFYLLLAVECGVERRFWFVVYWLGAFLLNFAVMKMMGVKP